MAYKELYDLIETAEAYIEARLRQFEESKQGYGL